MPSPEGSSVRFRRVPASLRRTAIERFARRLQKEVVKSRAFDILITGDAELRRLNRDFRGADKATNVLSFPAADQAYRGDIAIAYGVTRRQAKAAGMNATADLQFPGSARALACGGSRLAARTRIPPNI